MERSTHKTRKAHSENNPEACRTERHSYEQMGFPLGYRNDESPPREVINIFDKRFRFTGHYIIGHDYSRKPIMRCNHAEPNEPPGSVRIQPSMAQNTFSRTTYAL